MPRNHWLNYKVLRSALRLDLFPFAPPPPSLRKSAPSNTLCSPLLVSSNPTLVALFLVQKLYFLSRSIRRANHSTVHYSTLSSLVHLLRPAALCSVWHVTTTTLPRHILYFTTVVPGFWLFAYFTANLPTLQLPLLQLQQDALLVRHPSRLCRPYGPGRRS